MNQYPPRDLSPLWFWLPMGLVLLQLVVRFVSPEAHDIYIQGQRETGLVELMTPVALIPGIVFGIKALRLWEGLPLSPRGGGVPTAGKFSATSRRYRTRRASGPDSSSIAPGGSQAFP